MSVVNPPCEKLSEVGRELITVCEAAAFAGCSEQYIRKLCREGRIRCGRVGQHWRVNVASLREMLGL